MEYRWRTGEESAEIGELASLDSCSVAQERAKCRLEVALLVEHADMKGAGKHGAISRLEARRNAQPQLTPHRAHQASRWG
mmetsp:Transcript_102164/g.256075  ORF Transcript_102164/g.256075 Transcript_102164/m.256075 type:complete len:80 (+) Transcript_102164:1183-1422(+)